MLSASKWRLAPFAPQNGGSIQMAHACNAHIPQPPSKLDPSPPSQVETSPLLATFSNCLSPRLPGTRRERSSCISAGPGSSSSLRATQQSSCWHPPSASPPVLMTFINELRALWILMKLAPQREKETVCFAGSAHDSRCWFLCRSQWCVCSNSRCVLHTEYITLTADCVVPAVLILADNFTAFARLRSGCTRNLTILLGTGCYASHDGGGINRYGHAQQSDSADGWHLSEQNRPSGQEASWQMLARVNVWMHEYARGGCSGVSMYLDMSCPCHTCTVETGDELCVSFLALFIQLH